MMRVAMAFATATVFAGAVSAEPAPLADILAAMHGMEVRLSGDFGASRLQDGHRIRSPEGEFAVDMAANREQLKALDGCRLDHTDPMAACPVDMLAEIKIDAGQIRLIAFDVRGR